MSAQKGKTLRKPCFIGMQKSLFKYFKKKVQETNKKKTRLLQVHLSLEKKSGYIIPSMNSYLKNGQVRDLDFMHHKLFYLKQYQYLQHPILWVALNISIIVLRKRLIRVQSQHTIKQVGLTRNSKTSLVKNSDNIQNAKTLQ